MDHAYVRFRGESKVIRAASKLDRTGSDPRIQYLNFIVLKYAGREAGFYDKDWEELGELSWQAVSFLDTFRGILGFLVGVLFFSAATIAHTGLRIMNQLLWSRATRYPDWDDIV